MSQLIRIEETADCPLRDEDFRCKKDRNIICPDNHFPNDCPLEIFDDQEIIESDGISESIRTAIGLILCFGVFLFVALIAF